MTTIDEDGNELTWTAVYWRYMCKDTEECDSFEDAFRHLMWGEEYEQFSAYALLGPDGTVLMDEAALTHAYLKRLSPEDVYLKISTLPEVTS